MPVSAQIERLGRELGRLGERYSVELTDLYSLEGAERDAALDALVSGERSPFVLCEGKLLCTGSVEIPTVLAALG